MSRLAVCVVALTLVALAMGAKKVTPPKGTKDNTDIDVCNVCSSMVTQMYDKLLAFPDIYSDANREKKEAAMEKLYKNICQAKKLKKFNLDPATVQPKCRKFKKQFELKLEEFWGNLDLTARHGKTPRVSAMKQICMDETKVCKLFEMVKYNHTKKGCIVTSEYPDFQDCETARYIVSEDPDFYKKNNIKDFGVNAEL
jgi:hypothetical protein